MYVNKYIDIYVYIYKCVYTYLDHKMGVFNMTGYGIIP